MAVIDFRFRPPTEEFKASHRGLDSLSGSRAPEAWYNSNLEACIKEMEECDVIGVLLGRQNPPQMYVSNDHIKDLADKYPRSFIPIGGIDPHHRGACRDEINRLSRLKFKGIHFDPGRLDPPMLPDDRKLYPVYAQCEDLGLIAVIPMGPRNGPAYASPLSIDRVAEDFPKMQIILAHGCYPFVEASVALMWARPNVWLCPDSYHFQPEGDRYVKVFNGKSPLQDRYLYGSSYPYGPGIKARLEAWKNLPWDRAVLDKLLYGNAARLLGLH